MEVSDEKQDGDAAQTACQNNTNAKLQRQAQLVETALPAVHLATIAGKSLQQEVEVVGYLEYLNRLVAAAGNPQDPVVRMMVEQLAMANCRIGQLHVNAACATSAQAEVAYTLAAAKLMSETRKTSLALQQYIAAANSKASGSVTVPDSPPVAPEPSPQPLGVVTPPAEESEDTELTTNGSSRDHGKQTNAATNGSSPEPRTTKGPDPHRPRKAARNCNRLSALAVLNGSANGGGKGPFSG